MPFVKSLKKNSNRINSNINSYEDHSNYNLISKGDDKTITIDINIISKILDDLLVNKDVYLRDMNDKLKSQFDIIHTFAQILYNDNNAYKIFHNLINSKFSAVNVYKPLTIAWFVKGHTMPFYNNGDVKYNCNIFNSNTLLSTDNKLNTPCDDNIIIAEYLDNKWIFNTLNRNPKSTNSYLYVNFMDNENFVGFTTEEKKILKNFNIDSVFLIGYSSNINNLVSLNDGLLPVDKLKSRVLNIKSHDDNTNNNDNTYWVILIIAIILFLILLYVIYNK